MNDEQVGEAVTSGCFFSEREIHLCALPLSAHVEGNVDAARPKGPSPAVMSTATNATTVPDWYREAGADIYFDLYSFVPPFGAQLDDTFRGLWGG